MEEIMKRIGFIGGSDAVTIMNGDWIELWEIKTGRKEPPDLSKNLAVRMGNLTENFNIEWFEQERSEERRVGKECRCRRGRNRETQRK